MGLRHSSARHPSHHRRLVHAITGLVVPVLAITAALVPLPTSMLAAWRRLYTVVQPTMSRGAATLPIASLDLVCLVVIGLTLWRIVIAGRRRQPWALLRWLISTAAVLWLWFLLAWGWHYQVPTLEARFSAGRPEPVDVEAFAHATVAQLNALHDAAHAAPWPARAQLARELGPHLSEVLPELGVAWQPYLPSPRRTAIDPWFTWAGVDGMTNPFGLEVIVEGHVLPMELPALVAHEYGHLAGFADESDASVVAWLVCRRGRPALQYSGALAVLPHLASGLSGEARARVLGELGEGPRRDLAAIAARLSAQRAWAKAVAWQSYDGFLKANRVEEGVARYDAVTRVLATMADPVTGRLKSSPPAWPSAPRP